MLPNSPGIKECQYFDKRVSSPAAFMCAASTLTTLFTFSREERRGITVTNVPSERFIICSRLDGSILSSFVVFSFQGNNMISRKSKFAQSNEFICFPAKDFSKNTHPNKKGENQKEALKQPSSGRARFMGRTTIKIPSRGINLLPASKRGNTTV